MFKCIGTNKVCSNYNRKCKICILDDPERTYSMTDYEIMMKKEKEKEEYEDSIPKECKRCTLLERDYEHKKVKCLYRSNNNCILS